MHDMVACEPRHSLAARDSPQIGPVARAKAAWTDPGIVGSSRPTEEEGGSGCVGEGHDRCSLPAQGASLLLVASVRWEDTGVSFRGTGVVVTVPLFPSSPVVTQGAWPSVATLPDSVSHETARSDNKKLVC